MFLYISLRKEKEKIEKRKHKKKEDHATVRHISLLPHSALSEVLRFYPGQSICLQDVKQDVNIPHYHHIKPQLSAKLCSDLDCVHSARTCLCPEV